MKASFIKKFFASEEQIWHDIEDTKKAPLLHNFTQNAENDDFTPSLTQKLSNFVVRSNIFVLYALLGGISAGVGSLFIGKASTGGFESRMLIAIGDMIPAILYLAFKPVLEKLFSSPFEEEYSQIPLISTPKRKMIQGLVILLDAALSVGGGFLVVLTFEYAFYAGINQGIISTLFAFTSVFLSIFGYFIFKERINGVQVSGMTLLVASAVIYGFSGQAEASEYSLAPAWLAILMALASTAYFMLRSVAIKAYCVRHRYNALDFMAWSYVIWGLGLSVPLIYKLFSQGLNGSFVADCLIGGALQGTSMILMYYSISIGLSGPAAALASIQSPLQTILAAVFLAQVPNSLQVTGMALGLTGSVLISLSGYLGTLLSAKKLVS